MPHTFFFQVKQGKVESSIQSTNILKPEPIHATSSINKSLDTIFVGILLCDLARDFGMEFERLRHRDIFEISMRADKKL